MDCPRCEVAINIIFAAPDRVCKPSPVTSPVSVSRLCRAWFPRPASKNGPQPTRSMFACALKNPLLVGTHWFQYGDQATTGRGDGENYQIGFVDICDTPYAETIQACRAVSYALYPYRAGK